MLGRMFKILCEEFDLRQTILQNKSGDQLFVVDVNSKIVSVLDKFFSINNKYRDFIGKRINDLIKSAFVDGYKRIN